MSANPLRSAQVHRFRDFVAAYISGPDFKRGKYHATVYLTPGEARQIGAALVACADDVENRSFTNSAFRTVEIKPSA